MGGYAASLASGAQAGGAIGVQVPVTGQVAGAARFSVGRSAATLRLKGTQPVPAGSLPASVLVPGGLELGFAAELRWDFYAVAAWRAYFAVGLAGHYTQFAGALVASEPAGATIALTPGKTVPLTVFGPQAGFGTAWSLSPRWDLLVAVAYSAQFVLGRPVLDVAVIPAGTANRVPSVFVPMDAIRHQLSLQIGCGVRF